MVYQKGIRLNDELPEQHFLSAFLVSAPYTASTLTGNRSTGPQPRPPALSVKHRSPGALATSSQIATRQTTTLRPLSAIEPERDAS